MSDPQFTIRRDVHPGGEAMASLGMQGPYPLTTAEIDRQVTKTSPGNYALGRTDDEGTFRIHYVGRSDADVNARLKSWVGKTRQPQFKFAYATSPKAAFEKECLNYHDFSPPGNTSHPDRPAGSGWKCPRCRIFG
jgi:hypothetical protein